jgi:hypothetical protein
MLTKKDEIKGKTIEKVSELDIDTLLFLTSDDSYFVVSGDAVYISEWRLHPVDELEHSIISKEEYDSLTQLQNKSTDLYKEKKDREEFNRLKKERPEWFNKLSMDYHGENVRKWAAKKKG